MMPSQKSILDADGLGQWGAIAAAALSAGAAAYSAKQQKAGVAAQIKAQKEIAKMQQDVEMEKVKLMRRQAEMAGAAAPMIPGIGSSTVPLVMAGVAGVAVIILIAVIARRKRK